MKLDLQKSSFGSGYYLDESVLLYWFKAPYVDTFPRNFIQKTSISILVGKGGWDLRLL